MFGWIVAVVIVLILLANAIRVLQEYERGVVFRLGRFAGIKGPGVVLIIPFFDRLVRVSLRLVAYDVPPQDVITKDNVSVKVNAVVYFKIVEPAKSIIEVQDYFYATSQIAQTVLRSVCGEVELDELLSEREKINVKLQQIIDKETDPWGIKVTAVEIKHVDLPQEMVRAIARQAEAEREKRAKIIAAEGEYQAAQKVTDAARILEQSPLTLQLRYLQTLVEISAENSSTIVFPLPMEIIKPFIDSYQIKQEKNKK